LRRFIVVLAALLLAACRPESEPLSYDGKTVTARGVDAQDPSKGWGDILTVRASDDPAAPPLAGEYKRRGDTLTFTPAYPPSPQVTLTITYQAPGGEFHRLMVPGKAAPATAATTVTQTYPTTDRWPANQLKFYIQFSGPMTKGQAYRHIQLLDETGAVLEQPFVEFDQELWDPGVTRLTVLFDPGRIKRGLGDTDPPLVPGKTVTLRIDPAWQDAHGKPLAAAYERKITVVPDVRLPVDPAAWKITAPRDRNAPLFIDFPRPLDYALARRTITVPGVEGEVTLLANETRWALTPLKPWKAGRHEIHIDGIIEDLAGNRLYRPFDLENASATVAKAPPKSATLTFEVKG